MSSHKCHHLVCNYLIRHHRRWSETTYCSSLYGIQCKWIKASDKLFTPVHCTFVLYGNSLWMFTAATERRSYNFAFSPWFKILFIVLVKSWYLCSLSFLLPLGVRLFFVRLFSILLISILMKMLKRIMDEGCTEEKCLN